jgi:hypothetical protein
MHRGDGLPPSQYSRRKGRGRAPRPRRPAPRARASRSIRPRRRCRNQHYYSALQHYYAPLAAPPAAAIRCRRLPRASRVSSRAK